eukprot:scaffold44607_cov49-Attheya_sp.AAC.1
MCSTLDSIVTVVPIGAPDIHIRWRSTVTDGLGSATNRAAVVRTSIMVAIAPPWRLPAELESDDVTGTLTTRRLGSLVTICRFGVAAADHGPSFPLRKRTSSWSMVRRRDGCWDDAMMVRQIPRDCVAVGGRLLLPRSSLVAGLLFRT